jgi:hypothetical protein
MAKHLWFRDTKEETLMINRTVMRARAGLLILVPIFIAFSFFYFNSMLTTQWIIDDNTITSNILEKDNQDRQIYTIKAVKKTYDYSLETIILFYAFFDFLCGMSVWSAKFSPSILFAYFITKNKKPQYTLYAPKRFAWGMGLILIFTCILFFNPNILPFVGEVAIPLKVAITLLFTCWVFMWMELAFGYCFGCTIYEWFVKIGIFKEECYDCNDIYKK